MKSLWTKIKEFLECWLWYPTLRVDYSLSHFPFFFVSASEFLLCNLTSAMQSIGSVAMALLCLLPTAAFLFSSSGKVLPQHNALARNLISSSSPKVVTYVHFSNHDFC